jgi:hypothetical protein
MAPGGLPQSGSHYRPCYGDCGPVAPRTRSPMLPRGERCAVTCPFVMPFATHLTAAAGCVSGWESLFAAFRHAARRRLSRDRSCARSKATGSKNAASSNTSRSNSWKSRTILSAPMWTVRRVQQRSCAGRGSRRYAIGLSPHGFRKQSGSWTKFEWGDFCINICQDGTRVYKRMY